MEYFLIDLKSGPNIGFLATLYKRLLGCVRDRSGMWRREGAYGA